MTLRFKLLFGVVALAVVAAAGAYTYAAFVATAANSGNEISTGTVSLSDNDTGGAVLALSTASPGESDTGCIRVEYHGTLAAGVRLYGSTTGTGLDRYLDLTITRGSYSPSDPTFDSCTNFQADSTDYIGDGAGVVYSGTLEDFPDTWAAGLVDASSGSPEAWDDDEVHVYRFEVMLQDDIAAEGLNAAQSFTWEARNQ